MKMPAQSFVITWKIDDKSTTTNRTTFEIEAGEIDDAIVVASLVSGNSPRVKWQSNLRRNGADGPVVNITWSEWLGTPRSAQKPETPESIAARAKSDPDFRRRMLEQMGIVETIAERNEVTE